MKVNRDEVYSFLLSAAALVCVCAVSVAALWLAVVVITCLCTWLFGYTFTPKEMSVMFAAVLLFMFGVVLALWGQSKIEGK